MHLYLHMRNHQEWVEDPEGADFETLNDAREEAIVAARQIMSQRILRGQAADGSAFEITDEQGVVLLKVQFEEAIAAR